MGKSVFYFDILLIAWFTHEKCTKDMHTKKLIIFTEGGREAERKVTIILTRNVLLGRPKVNQRVSKVTTGVLKG